MLLCPFNNPPRMTSACKDAEVFADTFTCIFPSSNKISSPISAEQITEDGIGISMVFVKSCL